MAQPEEASPSVTDRTNKGNPATVNAATYDINKLIQDSTEPDDWLEHLTEDLMKFWDTDAAKTLKDGLFQTYRANDGTLHR